MKKLSKNQIIGIIVLVAVVYILWKKTKKDVEQNEIINGTSSNGTPLPTTSGTTPAWEKKYNALPSVGADTVLKKGMKAKEIWTVQYLYNEKIAKKEGKSKIGVDGIFGNETQTAVNYVLNNKYNFTRLNTWKNWVELSKADRIKKLNAQTGSQGTDATSQLLANAQVSPSDATFVYNPFSN